MAQPSKEALNKILLVLKKTGGTRISLMDFNEVAGRSRKIMKDGKIFVDKKQDS